MAASMKKGSVMAMIVPPNAVPFAFLVKAFGLWVTSTRVPSSSNSRIFTPAPRNGGQ